MKFTINGFVSSQKSTQPASPSPETLPAASAPRKSVVQVRFPGWDKGLAYYNDQFDPKPGDRVYVDGKLEGQLGIGSAIAERGHQYYMENRVQYLCLNGTKGYAIVQGSHAYTVEFEYQNGTISKLVCDCFCSYPCKHEFAATLQLRETLDLIQKQYAEEYAQTGCFAAICKETLFAFAISGKECGSFTM